jgi:hypothetical protein
MNPTNKISVLLYVLVHISVHAHNNESTLPSQGMSTNQEQVETNNFNDKQEQNKKQNVYINHAVDHTDELAFKMYVIVRTALMAGCITLASWAMYDVARAFYTLNFYGLEED